MYRLVTDVGKEARGFLVREQQDVFIGRQGWTHLRFTTNSREDVRERLNVLYEKNWTRLVHEQLRNFEASVVSATKVEGYDGKDVMDNDRQWSFSGAMLYSVTVITTIGNRSPLLVGIVSGIAYRDPWSISSASRFFCEAICLKRGQLGLVRKIEELLEYSSGTGLEN
uniref:Uncharacterized protein n=1 Tax=Timema bartmani TaxID=61472 RepID=A0A7R9F1Z8_9NEOP|nr:unnamed protein product [Timema bartmani]